VLPPSALAQSASPQPPTGSSAATCPSSRRLATRSAHPPVEPRPFLLDVEVRGRYASVALFEPNGLTTPDPLESIDSHDIVERCLEPVATLPQLSPFLRLRLRVTESSTDPRPVLVPRVGNATAAPRSRADRSSSDISNGAGALSGLDVRPSATRGDAAFASWLRGPVLQDPGWR
jgi:hypothetical protein